MAKLSPRERAQVAALRGDVETAVAELTSLQQQGDTAAHAGLAEIAAYQGKWDAVMQHAPAVTADPSAIRTFNVYDDMIRLVGLAGLHVGRWDEIKGIAEAAVVASEAHSLDTHAAAAAGLVAFAAARGNVSQGWRPGRYDDRPEPERAAKYDTSIAKLVKNKKKFKTPQAQRNHYIAIAENCLLYDVALALYDEGELPELFDSVVFVASALARAGRSDEAWTAVRSKLSVWWPFEDTQLAPVELLADEALRPLMIPERCNEVLRTPRGPQAAG